jgi:hypothetical protein
MTRWQVVGPDQKYMPLMELWTIWGYWPEDDAVELHAAVDQYTEENNREHYEKLLSEAQEKYGKENVRVALVRVPWTPIHEMFDPAQVEADIPQPLRIEDNA